jgi:peptidoglycan L-alanyl-D-glutamate endopeptidase CwlK
LKQLSERDYLRLKGVDPRLISVVERAAELSDVDFFVTEGLRTRERQAVLVAKGASQTMNSKHIVGKAVDIAAMIDGEVRWDWPLYMRIAEAFKAAAEELGVNVVWGGTWKPLSVTDVPIKAGQLSRAFPDGPHYEIKG